jgi:hypothetical protein
MRLPTRHPRLSAAACRVYGAAIWFYPADFRHAFGHELIVAFRNRVEDVLDGGGLVEWIAFAVHIVLDWVHTCSTLVADADAAGSGSLLGLSDGDVAHGCLARTHMDASLVFVAGGVVLSCAGWYVFLAFLLSFVR